MVPYFFWVSSFQSESSSKYERYSCTFAAQIAPSSLCLSVRSFPSPGPVCPGSFGGAGWPAFGGGFGVARLGPADCSRESTRAANRENLSSRLSWNSFSEISRDASEMSLLPILFEEFEMYSLKLKKFETWAALKTALTSLAAETVIRRRPRRARISRSKSRSGSFLRSESTTAPKNPSSAEKTASRVAVSISAAPANTLRTKRKFGSEQIDEQAQQTFSSPRIHARYTNATKKPAKQSFSSISSSDARLLEIMQLRIWSTTRLSGNISRYTHAMHIRVALCCTNFSSSHPTQPRIQLVNLRSMNQSPFGSAFPTQRSPEGSLVLTSKQAVPESASTSTRRLCRVAKGFSISVSRKHLRHHSRSEFGFECAHSLRGSGAACPGGGGAKGGALVSRMLER